MSVPAPLICLIAPGHVASTPRLVKNADALAAAGYRVHVIAGRHYPPVDPLDAEIFATAPWTHQRVDYGHGAGVLVRKLLRHIARRLVQCPSFASATMAARAHQAEIRRLVAAAAHAPAQFYFGHCLAGLPAAAFAAQARRVPYGFDAEDFHDAETENAASDPAESGARRLLQSRLLPGCALFTAASPLIAQSYERAYGIKPQVLLNVFPRQDAPAAPVQPGPITADRPARVYWFSQTVGPGRGLEAVVAILGRMSTPVELHLRGLVTPGYRTDLSRRAAAGGMARPIRFLDSGPPAEMVRLAAGADLGLSTEESRPLNRDLCLTNKIFVYLLAGIPQLLSTTTAQRALAPELGPAALLAGLGEPAPAAAVLDAFLTSPARVAEARRTAWELAQRRFNWDVEKAGLLEAVRGIIGPP